MSISNDLRQAVLQAAIQGKLTKQLPEDGNAKDLLEQIKAEKEKLIKEGKLKKEKPLPEITEDEKPFDIPENWEWVRLGEIILFLGGYAYKSEKYVEISRNQIVRLGNVKVHRIDLASNPVFISDEQALETEAYKILEDDILITMTGTRLKRDYLYATKVNGSILLQKKLFLNQRVGCLRTFNKNIGDYLLLVLHSEIIRNIIFKKETGTANQGNLGSNDLKKYVYVPLPSLSEQKRIVAKVEELMAKIGELEKTEQELESLKKAFPADMKASLLQAAMQGKLTEQLPEDGNAKDLLEQIKAEKAKLIKDGKLKKEKPLPEITEDEIPFDIPENWEWVRIGEAGMTLTGNTPSTTKLEYYNGDVPFIGPGDISIDSQINYDTSKKLTALGAEVARLVKNETLLQVCIGGSIGKVCLVERTVAFNQQINALTPIKMLSKFAFYVMKSQMFLDGMFEKSTGTATPIINRTAWEQLLIPLPPLSEQKRIVEKLDKLLPLCDGLK